MSDKTEVTRLVVAMSNQEERHTIAIRKMAGRIEHLERQLRHHGITPMGEFICACGIRKSPPVENEAKF